MKRISFANFQLKDVSRMTTMLCLYRLGGNAFYLLIETKCLVPLSTSCSRKLQKKYMYTFTYLASSTRAKMPAAKGADAEVPVCELVH